MSKIKSVVIDHTRPSHLRLGELDYPQPQPNQALVKVAAFSLNPGELGGAARRENGSQIGWDLAGTVVQAAANGSGPQVGQRVVGTIVTGGWTNSAPTIGAWAEVVAVSTAHLAELPANVTITQAATLPVAGLTALAGLEKNGSLWQKRVLVTAANGAVGDFGVQIARSAGAFVVGTVRNRERAAGVRESGAYEVVVGDPAQARQFGPYDLVLDSLGGRNPGHAVPRRSGRHGRCQWNGPTFFQPRKNVPGGRGGPVYAGPPL